MEKNIQSSDFASYGDLAWIETIITSPDDYIEETEMYCSLIREYAQTEVNTLLHLGCGAGGNDYTFRKHFNVTGIDLSEGMLEIARKYNPEVRYINGDMRTFCLPESFDAITIPDSIDYLKTPDELRMTLKSCYNHLKPGGVLLLVCNLKEDFRENNFVYKGTRENTEVTLFENNYIPDKQNGLTYEAAFVFLVRQNGELKIYTDCHLLGLFGLEIWNNLLKEEGFVVQVIRKSDAYEPYIMEEGEYPQTIFVCTKA